MPRFYNLSALLHLYIGWRLIPDLLSFGSLGAGAMVLWLIASLVLIPLGLRARRTAGQRFSRVYAWAGLLAMGLFSSLFVLTVIPRDVALLCGLAVSKLFLAGASLQPLLDGSAVAVPILAALATIIGVVNARKLAKVRFVNIPIAGLPARLHGFTIAQISDVHVGPTIRRGYVDAIVDAVNALHADVVAVTGDVVDGTVEQLSGHTQPLSRLSAPHGVFLVTGNHEYDSGVRAWVAEFRRLGLQVLMNEHVVLRYKGAEVVVAGVTDFNADRYDPAHRSDPAAALAHAPENAAINVLLAHQPRSAYAAQAAGYDLQLSGHTHGGQFLPWNFFCRFHQPFTAGLHRLGKLWIYVNRGAGYWGPPMRLGAPSEITRFKLVPA